MKFKAWLIYWKNKLFGETISKHAADMAAYESNWEQSFCEKIDNFFLNLQDIGDILKQIHHMVFSSIGRLVVCVDDWRKGTWIYRFTH